MCKKVKKRFIVLLLIITAMSLPAGSVSVAHAKTDSAAQWTCSKKKVKTKKSKKGTYIKKLKKKSSKTKTTTKTKKLSSKTSSKVSKDKKKKIKTVVQKSLVTESKYKKGSKKVKITETVVTKTITYIYKIIKDSSEFPKEVTSRIFITPDGKPTDPYKYPSGIYDIAVLAPLADSNVINAFRELDMTCKIDPTCPTTGVFSVRTRSLTISYYGDHIYHELGHFLFFVAGNLDREKEAYAIYQAEMDKVTSYKKAYTNSTVNEYFAEAYLSYLLDTNALKNTRPRTYAYVENALKTVTDTQTQRVKDIYSPVWN